MARLRVKSSESSARVIDLKLGLTRLGRNPDNDFEIDHPTISGRHCEIWLDDRGVVGRDVGSTNGTFIDGQPVR